MSTGILYSIEVALATRPVLAASLVAGGAVLALTSLAAVGARVAVALGSDDNPKNNKRLAARWAYSHPRLLRITQSPCWLGGLMVGLGLVLGTAYTVKAPAGIRWTAMMEEAKTPALQSAMAAFAKGYDERSIARLWWKNRKVTTPEAATAEISSDRNIELLGACLVFFGTLVALSKWKREAVGERFHGRAAWAARSEVSYAKDRYWSMPIRVTQDGTRTFEETVKGPFTALGPSPKSQASMGAIYGALGSGKGAYLMGHWFISARPGLPIVYQDSKGECPASILRPSMLRFGIPAKKPKGLPSMRFNPIDAINEEGISQTMREMRARTLANLVLPAPEEGSDNGWITETAQPLLADGFLRKRWAHLGELADEVEGRPLPVILDNLAVAAGRQFSLGGKNVLEYAANEISNNTQPYLRGWARHAFSASDFSWSEVYEKGLYVMSASEDRLQKIPIQLFWSLFWAELQSSDTAIPMLVLMDEAIAAGPIPNILEAVVKLRDRGVSIWMAFQTIAGVEEVYGKARGEALRRALVNSIVLTNGLDAKDAHEVALELGTYTQSEKQKDGSKRREKYNLLPESDLASLAGMENEHWAIFRGRGITTSGRPLIAKLFPMPQGTWNVKTSVEDYEALEREFGHGVAVHSEFEFVRSDEYRALANLAVEAAKGDRTLLVQLFRAVDVIFASDLPDKRDALSRVIKKELTLEAALGERSEKSLLELVPESLSVDADEDLPREGAAFAFEE